MKAWMVFFSVVLMASQAQAQCLKGDCLYGKGIKKFKSGAVYTGEFKEGQIHGQGKVVFSDGSSYEGQWQANVRSGKGKMEFSNGDLYRGDFQKNHLQGKGLMNYSSGDTYEGEFKEGAKDGQGTYKTLKGDVYKGSFKGDLRHGYGEMTYHTGSVYKGSWAGDAKEGHGIYIDEDGYVYEGEWAGGEYISAEAGSSPAAPSDTPAASASSSASSSLADCNATICDGIEGIYMYSDGSKFVGTHQGGYPEGEGTIFYANGDKYTGGWSKHAPHGKGIMVYHDGRSISAYWDYGRPTHVLENDEGIASEHIEVEQSQAIKVWAVIVGVGRYEHMQALKYTDDDAYRMYAFLKSPEGGAIPDEQISVLIDEDASRSNMLRTMRRVFLKADANDVVMLYFSGHGLEGSFVPSDYTGYNNLVQHDEIIAIFKESKAKHKIVFADACHSGSMLAMKSAESVQQTVDKYYSAFERADGGTALLLSSKAEETSLEDSGLRQGVFSHFLMKGLKGQADVDFNKVVTISELYNYVKNEVVQYTLQSQTPNLIGDYDLNMPVGIIR